MRLAFVLASLAALACAGSASAGQVLVGPIAYSPQFQTALNDDLGVQEGAVLSADVSRALTRALERHGVVLGGGDVTVQVSIVSADPNRFTREQYLRSPDVDWARSFSRGGAELHAVIKSADGLVLGEVDHRHYDNSLADLIGRPMTWTTAERAIDQFAEKVAVAYEAQTTH